MPELSGITDPDLPEPKGASSALVGTTYQSDGAGSGSWKNMVGGGFVYLQNTQSAQSVTSGASWTKLRCNSSGTETVTSFLSPGITNPWDTSTSTINLSTAGASIGDIIRIRANIFVENTSTLDRTAQARITRGNGSGNERYITMFNSLVVGSTSTYNNYEFSSFIESSDYLNNPWILEINSSAGGVEATMTDLYIEIVPRKIVGE